MIQFSSTSGPTSEIERARNQKSCMQTTRPVGKLAHTDHDAISLYQGWGSEQEPLDWRRTQKVAKSSSVSLQ